jgi:hypothetical protein
MASRQSVVSPAILPMIRMSVSISVLKNRLRGMKLFDPERKMRAGDTLGISIHRQIFNDIITR